MSYSYRETVSRERARLPRVTLLCRCAKRYSYADWEFNMGEYGGIIGHAIYCSGCRKSTGYRDSPETAQIAWQRIAGI